MPNFGKGRDEAMSSEYAPPVYPVIKFLVARGDGIAILLGLAPALAGFWFAAQGWPWGLAAAGIAAGALLWVVFRSYIEVLRIIADTLMPR